MIGRLFWLLLAVALVGASVLLTVRWAHAQDPNAHDPNFQPNPYKYGSIEYRCHYGNVGACTRWRKRECANGVKAACAYSLNHSLEWCQDHYDDMIDIRWCWRGSPDE